MLNLHFLYVLKFKILFSRAASMSEAIYLVTIVCVSTVGHLVASGHLQTPPRPSRMGMKRDTTRYKFRQIFFSKDHPPTHPKHLETIPSTNKLMRCETRMQEFLLIKIVI